MHIVNIHEAKTSLSALIQMVLSGEQVIIANNNQPVVELKRLESKVKKRTAGLLKGKIAILEDWEEADKELEELLQDTKIFPDE